MGNLEIQEIKIPDEVKGLEDFEKVLANALNEAIIEVNKCTQKELQEMIMNYEG